MVSLPYRLAVGLVILVGALALLVITWDDKGCAPESGNTAGEAQEVDGEWEEGQ